MAQVEKKLADLGIVLPTPAAPGRQLRPLRALRHRCCSSPARSASAPTASSSPRASLAQAYRSRTARKRRAPAPINLLAQVKAALGDLDKVVRVVRLGGFINSAPIFLEGPKVMNGASDLMVEVFGDKGRHARTTVGVAALPADAAVEVEGLFEVT